MIQYIKTLLKMQPEAIIKRAQVLERRVSADRQTVLMLLKENKILRETLDSEQTVTAKSKQLIEIQNERIEKLKKNLDEACGTICMLRTRLHNAKKRLFNLGDEETFLEQVRFEARGLIDSVEGA